MRISRRFANGVKFITDQLMPPILRDSKLFGSIFLFCIFGKNYKLFLNFKENATKASVVEIKKIYFEVYNKKIAVNRETDLNDSCMAYILRNVVGNKVLEVGCGRGLLVKNLIKKNKKYQISACDIVLDKSLKQIKGATFVESQMEALPFKSLSFNTVVTTHTLEHAYNIQAAISELRRVCRKRLIIVVPMERPYLYTPNLHLHFFPSASYLLNFIRGKNAKCFILGGDLVYIERVNS